MITAEQYKDVERGLVLEEARLGWEIPALVYALVIALLTTVNVLLVVFTDANFLWFPFPLVGWGIGLAMHYRYGFRHADEVIERRQEKIELRAHRAHPAT
jgi:2TM domain-containing protein